MPKKLIFVNKSDSTHHFFLLKVQPGNNATKPAYLFQMVEIVAKDSNNHNHNHNLAQAEGGKRGCSQCNLQ